MKLTTTNAILGAIALRAILLVIGVVQDAVSPVKYTDIDYAVFTASDAAALVASGRSPFDRATYRYTPLLAWILVGVNGKILFCICDLIAAWCIAKINRCAI
ncbi:UNVERIFIED_CONTAM: GPI mannosyltransferase 1 [Siphonaria sp. JEL0065]|nr:GPI mannosyltransferase 1 [Siphonaria sp. JEL0065]